MEVVSKFEERAQTLSKTVLGELKNPNYLGMNFCYVNILDSWMLDEYYALTYEERVALPSRIEEICRSDEFLKGKRTSFSNEVSYGVRYLKVFIEPYSPCINRTVD